MPKNKKRPMSAPANKRKTKGKSSNLTAILRMFMILLVIVLLVFVAAQSFGDLTLSNVSAGVKEYFVSLRSGDGYPYKINSSSVVDIETAGTSLIILTDTSTLTVDASAKTVNREQHTFVNPVIDIKNGRGIVYDRSGSRFKVQSRTSLIGERDVQNSILTSSVGKSGNIAVATRAKEASSRLTVYNKNLVEIFVWDSANDHIVDVALSDNGKSVAVAVIGAKQGETYSTVYVFDFDYSEPVSVSLYPGTALFNVQFNGKGTVIALGDNLRSVIKNKKDRQDDETFGTNSVARFAQSNNGKSVLLFTKYGSMSSTILKAYDAKGEEVFTKEFDSIVRWVDCNDRNIAVLFDNKIVTYNYKGNEQKEISTENDAMRVIMCGTKIYVIATGEIRQY